MKIINSAIVLAFSSKCLAAQNPSQLQKFVPQNWQIISQTQGDLNQDGLNDAAIIIQPKDRKILDRKLLILINQNHVLQPYATKQIPKWTYRDTENCIDEAIDEDSIKINKSLLDITFNGMNSCSNWYGESWTYRFKLSQQQFKLVGFEYWFAYKTDGKATRHIGNFLTQKLKTTIYNEFDDQIKPKITWKKLSQIQPNTLDKIQLQDDQNFLKQMIK